MNRAVASLCGAAALVLAGPAGSAAPAPAEHVIAITGMHFTAPAAGIKAGDVIVWVNRDIVRHSATARDGSFNLELPPRTSGRTIVRRPGNVAFYCRFHPAMQGVLHVLAR